MDLAPCIGDIARLLLGTPNEALSTRTQWRCANNSSIAVEVAGPCWAMTAGDDLDRGNPRFAIVCPAYVIGKGLPARALEMLMVIAEARCNSTGKTIPLSHRQIAYRLDMHFKNVPRCLGGQLAVGALEVLSRGTGPGGPSIYRVVGTIVDRRATVFNSEDGSTRLARATVLNAEDNSVRKKESSVPVSNETAPDGTSDLANEVVDLGVRILTRQSIPEGQARTLAGECRSQLGNAATLDLLLSVARDLDRTHLRRRRARCAAASWIGSSSSTSDEPATRSAAR